jgi:hypothetical protein
MKNTRLFLFIILLLAAVSSFGQAGVGIGTTTPSGQLHIAGTNLLDTARGSIVMSRYWIDSTDTRASAIYHLYNTAVNKDQLVFGVSGDVGAYTSPLLNSNAKLVIQADGNVGIGTTTPGAKLEIAGGVKVADSINIGGQVRITGGSPAAGKVLTSDAGGVASWSSPSGAHQIGESYGGGIVFYVYDNGQHGLIAATSDQSTGIRGYGGSYTNTRARADGVGAGLKNTAIIIANQGPVDGNAFAATVCNEYSVTVNGVTYGDWYLPSTHELNLLYLQKSVVGGFAGSNYWSSSENSNTTAWGQDFDDGLQSNGPKDYRLYVRAVRAF